MPISSINRSPSMQKLAAMLFAEDLRTYCDDGEAGSPRAQGEDIVPSMAGASKACFERFISEGSTAAGLPFSRITSGYASSEQETDADVTEGGASSPMPSSLHFEDVLDDEEDFVIAVARDGSCHLMRSHSEEEEVEPLFLGSMPAEDPDSLIAVDCKGACTLMSPLTAKGWPQPPEEEEQPVLAVARDGTCRFTRDTEEEREGEPLIAVHRDGTCEFVRPVDGTKHLGYMNHLSYAPWYCEEKPSSVVLVSPAGKSFYFEDSRNIDWEVAAVTN